MTVAGFGGLALAACLLAPLVGSTPIRLTAVFDRSIPFADNVDAQIFFVARLPRVLAAALVGSGLALAGVVFQALLRNPLASPDTLGVSAGAALGAVLAITFNADFSLLGISAIPLATLAGSLGALAIVYGLSTARRRGASSLVLLLAGVTLTTLLGALTAFVRYLADFTQTLQTVRWLMGSLDVGSYGPIGAALVPLTLACAGFATLPRSARSDQRRRRVGRRPRRGRAARREDRARERVAGDRRCGVARRPALVCRHHRAPSCSAARGRRSPSRAAGGGALWISVSRSRAISSRGRHSRQPNFLSVLSPPSLEAQYSYGCSSAVSETGAESVDGRARLRILRGDATLRRSLGPVPLRTARGSSAAPTTSPRRIISLIPATTEMLFAMGAADRLAGVGTYDKFPPEVERLPRVGGLLDPSVERILSLKPDLVIVYDTQAELKGQLARAEIPTFRYVHRGLPDITATMRALGVRVGAASAADAAASRIEQQLVAIKTRVARRPRLKTLLVFGREPGSLRHVDASGGYGFLHDVLEIAGGTDVLARPEAAGRYN